MEQHPQLPVPYTRVLLVVSLLFQVESRVVRYPVQHTHFKVQSTR